MTWKWTRRHFTLTTLFLISMVVTLDQGLKTWVRSANLEFKSNWIDLTPHFNEGMLGGVFSDLHPWIIRIFFSVLFGFIVLLTSLLLHFLRHKEIWRLKYGIVLYIAGILGNVWDRAASGQITDFININLPGLRGFAFNFADLVLLSGLVLTVFSLIVDHHRIWFEGNQRKSVIIESRFQIGFSAFIVFMAVMNTLIIGIYSFTFLKVYLDTTTAVPEAGGVIRDYLLGLLVIEIGFLLIAVGTGLIFSHRMAGPIYAFEKYIERILNPATRAQSAPFRLRNLDYFKSLETTAEQVFEYTKNPK